MVTWEDGSLALSSVTSSQSPVTGAMHGMQGLSTQTVLQTRVKSCIFTNGSQFSQFMTVLHSPEPLAGSIVNGRIAVSI